ncbi:MAG TPA: TOBE domain-containing protein [Candidatus Udaeobacter sp.]|jgi:molybdopterin-binding protein|nr:TOBE domain-containing protein [Candidatus Udaeobacter sp.]
MEQSIRNQFPGTVKSIVSDKVLNEVIVETSIGEIASIILCSLAVEIVLTTLGVASWAPVPR